MYAYKYTSMQVCKCASMQLWKYASICMFVQVCKYTQICKYIQLSMYPWCGIKNWSWNTNWPSSWNKEITLVWMHLVQIFFLIKNFSLANWPVNRPPLIYFIVLNWRYLRFKYFSTSGFIYEFDSSSFIGVQSMQWLWLCGGHKNVGMGHYIKSFFSGYQMSSSFLHNSMYVVPSVMFFMSSRKFFWTEHIPSNNLRTLCVGRE